MSSSFYTQFRNEHRLIRDLLFDLITCLLQKDIPLFEWEEKMRGRKKLII